MQCDILTFPNQPLYVPKVIFPFPIDLTHVQTGGLPVQLEGRHLNFVKSKWEIDRRRMFFAYPTTPIRFTLIFFLAWPMHLRCTRSLLPLLTANPGMVKKKSKS